VTFVVTLVLKAVFGTALAWSLAGAAILGAVALALVLARRRRAGRDLNVP
jgi:hypothetical protein